MKKIRVSFDPIGYTSKPSKTDIKKINNRIAQCIKEINTPKEMKTFAEMVGAEGHAFCPAAFSNGRRCKENFEQQNLLLWTLIMINKKIWSPLMISKPGQRNTTFPSYSHINP